MTRTRTGEYKEAENAPRERRIARNGLSDIRAIPKKSGGGAGNWGVPGSEVDAQEALARGESRIASSPTENKISVMDADTFSRLQENQSTTSGQQHNATQSSQ
ncbi:hypothetical protein DFQ26_008551 [Actinomortierella ambigua]|nr:hypothetical protein DFQ26_008551 [Actinomortierella ambigua]